VDDDRELRRARLRDPRSYATVGEWYDDYRGFVPIQCAHALSRLIQARGITFAEAYDHLVRVGTIIEVRPMPGGGSGTRDNPPQKPGSKSGSSTMRRNRVIRVAIVWTAVGVVIAFAAAAVALARLSAGEQACFFSYPATPCPDGPDLLPVAFLVIPGDLAPRPAPPWTVCSGHGTALLGATAVSQGVVTPPRSS
jgi:hypothetical protein